MPAGSQGYASYYSKSFTATHGYSGAMSKRGRDDDDDDDLEEARRNPRFRD